LCEASRNGSTFTSNKRVTPPTASVRMQRAENEVILTAARIAMSAVLISRFSPLRARGFGQAPF
jgi:hypothetical protein